MEANKTKEKSNTIKQNADRVLENLNLRSLLEHYGEVIFTGSYALDTMIWNDIDLQLKIEDPLKEKQILSEILSKLINSFSIKKVNYIDFYINGRPEMPKGRYLGLVYWDTLKKEEWKIDLWILAQEDFEKNREFMQKMTTNLVGVLKERALDLKAELTDRYGRPPQMASYHIYKCLVEQSPKTDKEVYAYLREQGVDV